jgi:diguanylate cyclase
LNEQFEAALDTVALFLRVFGQKAFDTDETEAEATKRHFEQLAMRIVMGAPRSEADLENARRELRRDWGTVRNEVSRHRSHEHDYVVKSLSNLRAAVQAFVTSLSVSIADDRSQDDKITRQVDRLADAVSRNDTEQIRREAFRVTEVVREVTARRREREKAQLLALGERVRTLRDELSELRQKAALDPLTKLFNRAAFDEELDRVAALGLLLGNQPCLLMVDIDHFKAINDDFGHIKGDEVLKLVADTLVRNFLRKEDFVARYGGEEFAVVVPNMTFDAVAGRAERVRQTIEALDLSSRQLTRGVTVSVGLAVLVPGETPSNWVERADKALYAAKNGGRNRLVVVDPASGQLGALPVTDASVAAQRAPAGPPGAVMPGTRTAPGAAGKR